MNDYFAYDYEIATGNGRTVVIGYDIAIIMGGWVN